MNNESTCKGSITFGTACMRCSKCKKELANIAQCLCKTKEEAEFVKRQKEAYLELIDKIAELNDGWRPDWSMWNEKKWFFAYDHEDKEVMILFDVGDQTQADEIYMNDDARVSVFTSVAIAKIKLALWGIE